MEKTISLGKIDLDGIGRKDNLVEVYLRLDKNKDDKPVFGIYGNIWNRIKSNTLVGGQCEDEINKHLPNNLTWRKIYSVWKNYHNNDLNAGSPRQEAFVKELNPTIDELNSFSDSYSYCCKELEKAGLLVDKSYLHNGKPYRYGTAWIYQEIPDKGLEEIKSLINSND